MTSLRDHDPETWLEEQAFRQHLDDQQAGSFEEQRETDRAYGISPAERFDLDQDARRQRELTLAHTLDADDAAADGRGFE